MNNDITGWFTTEDGVHVPIHGGESKVQAMNRQFNKDEVTLTTSVNTQSSTPTKLNNRQNIIDYVQKQVGVDLTKSEYKSNKPRTYMGVDFREMPQRDKLRVLNALHSYGHNVQVLDNGGLGSAIYFER